MSTPLRSFTGFKGKIAFAQIDNISFVLMAKNAAQLETLWAHIMATAGRLDPAGIKSAILIEAANLPDHKPAVQHEDNLDRINRALAGQPPITEP